MPHLSMVFKTELIFWRAEGEIIDRGEYWLIRTPSDPTYYGGNLLFFECPPGEGDYQRWLKLFELEFKNQPKVRHVLYIWDIPNGEIGMIAPFLDDGFEVQSNITLVTSDVAPPPKLNYAIETRRIETDQDWEAVLEAKLRNRDARFDLETYAPFKKRWLDARRRMAGKGQGGWYGAFIGDQLVGDLGLYHDGGVARFQDVGTEPAFRRRGICGTLVYEVSKHALESGGIETLVMVADEDYHAAKIYESVGFKPKEQHAVACRRPPK